MQKEFDMKRFTAILLLAAVMLSLAACRSSEPEPTPDPHEA